ncbi:Gfo/Idh/MocA family protein [Streptomyces candidus]|uniref:Putative dehydrogenase n=1 Tax=Streptomyces candidus TaxID=67283 RepID=A0A7X0LRV4_9ACTN|nr:Gfo/Idh/MocA family oxidoreductase [Streptomyces candidus]MBB6438492.1 putative dehydrogenase [Streptomyces candidus]GHH45696.1 oxidoreductase [Streptomyces candidus]
MSEQIINWGILATGGMAAAFTEDLLREPGARVAAVGSRSEAGARQFAHRFGVARAHGSWHELVADPEVDVVYVATPHAHHLAAATACLEAGKPVLCEKPFALSGRQARLLTELAARRKLLLMEAMWTYVNPLVRRIVELTADGAIGEIRSLHARFGGRVTVAPQHRLWDPAAGGGALLDLGTYPVSFAQLLLGAPESVTAHARLSPQGVDEQTGILLGHPGGAMSVLSCSLLADDEHGAVVYGTEGRIEIPADFFNPSAFVLHRDGHEPKEYTAPPRRGNGYGHQAREVMRCLRSGLVESPLVPLAGTLAVMDTLDAVRARIGVRYPGE